MGDVDNWLAKYMEFVNRGLGMIPYDANRKNVWKEFFFNPTATIAKNIDSTGNRLKDLYVATLVGGFIALVGLIPTLGLTMLTGGGIVGVGIILGIVAIAIIIGPIFDFLYSLLEYLVARFVGGVGDIQANFNASTLPGLSTFALTLPLLIIRIPFAWLGAIPIINLCASILELPITIALLITNLYGLYLKYLAFKEVHKLSTIRAAAVVVLPIIVIIALVVILLIVFYVALLGLVLSAGYMMPSKVLRG